jgi:hypothetical protein
MVNLIFHQKRYCLLMGTSFAISWDFASALVKLTDFKYLYIDTFNLVKSILVESFI